MTFSYDNVEILIQEVSPRDGLQNESCFVQTTDKVSMIDALSQTGLRKIEVSSFVSPKAIPALRDAREVFASIQRLPGVTYTALVPNLKGAVAAMEARADELNMVMSASEAHNRANVNMSCEQSLSCFRAVIRELQGCGTRLNGTVATAFGCPFEGLVAFDRVVRVVQEYLDIGFGSITLADTTGLAYPTQVYDLARRVNAKHPEVPLALHFHNTRGMALANVIAGMNAGVRSFDASIGGIGGCPFAPGATGNVCTEDLVHMLQLMGAKTQIDLLSLIRVSRALPRLIGHETAGQVAKSGPNWQINAEYLDERRRCDVSPADAKIVSLN
jgi:hydroxymethylglutaryl-CoA lyase